ncbi:MAG: sigma-70 family RNA polymerase sigma factor [Cyclobacteriaceae bacterium]
MNNPDDFHYLNLVLEGDVSAYRWLIEKYKGPSFSLAIRILKNKEDAEDVVQEGFIRVYKSLRKFNRESSFATWLYKIMYNQCIDRVRKKKVDLVDLKHADQRTDNTYDQLENENRDKIIGDIVNELPTEENAIIRLFYEHDKDMKEIGVITGLSHATVRKKISRSRNKIKHRLVEVLGEEAKDLI